jgi:phosphatidate cytidylyltransferase
MIAWLRGLSDPVLLFLGIGAVLVLATAVAEGLRWRQRGRPSPVIDNLVSRIRPWSGWRSSAAALA